MGAVRPKEVDLSKYTKEEKDWFYVKKHKRQLDSIFYGDDVLHKNVKVLWASIKKQEIPITYHQALLYYNNQEVVQRFRPIKLPPKGAYGRIKTGKPLQVLYSDTFFIDNCSVVVVMDLYSKYAWATASRNAVTSELALKALKDFLGRVGASIGDVGEVRTDNGTEYASGFQSFVGNKHKTTLAYQKTEAAPVERLCGTLMRSLEKMREARGGGLNWVFRHLPVVLRSYNSQANEGIGHFTPYQVFTRPETYSDNKGATTPYRDNIGKGDTVRIVVRDMTNVMDRKIKPNWSKETFLVTSRRGNRLSLENGRAYKPWYVQKIDPEMLMKGPEKAVPPPPTETEPRPPAPAPAQKESVADRVRAENKRERKKRVLMDL